MYTASMLNILIQHKNDNRDLERFWKLESLGLEKEKSDEDLDFLRRYQQTSIKFENGHYSTKLPWKQEHADLPSNFSITNARTEATIRKSRKS